MGGILCKIFRFALNIFSSVVEAVAEAVKIVGTASVDVLSELLESAGDAVGGIFGGSGSLIMLALLGAGVYLIAKPENKEGSTNDRQIA